MSAGSILPDRPSLEQLRKQARERLRLLRRDDPDAKLSDAQLALAREHGFASWPRLVHHIEQAVASERLTRFERLAEDILAGYHGNPAALERLGAHFGDSSANARRKLEVRDRLDALHRATEAPTLDDARRMLARLYGYDTWDLFAVSLSQPVVGGHGYTPPFYRVHAEQNVIEPRPPLTDADWDHVFEVMKERRITGIRSAALTDRVVARLSRLDFVTRIDAGGARALTDDGLLRLERMPQLEALDLSGWHSPITDRGLAVLGRLPALRRLLLCWAQRITDAGLAGLAACEHLESVNAMGTHTGDGLIAAVRGRDALVELATGRRVTDSGLALLHDIPAFRTWRGGTAALDLMSFQGGPTRLLLDGPFTDRGLAALAGLDGLASLNLGGTASFTGDGLAVLRLLPNLTHFGCDGDRCDDVAMATIAEVPHLRMLMAQGTVATDDGFVGLSRSQSLEYLWGRECPNLRGRGFASLADMPALRGLGVSCLRVDDDALARLPDFPVLRELMPMDVSDAGFRHVGRCTNLEKLWCMYCRDTGDAATAHIADLALSYYYAGKTRITDRSLEILGTMDSLEKIELWEIAGITDAGMAALARLPELRSIEVSGSPNVTRGGLGVFPPTVRVSTG